MITTFQGSVPTPIPVLFSRSRTYRLFERRIPGVGCGYSSVAGCRWWVLSMEEFPAHKTTKKGSNYTPNHSLQHLLFCSIWANCSAQNINNEINHCGAEVSFVSDDVFMSAFSVIYILTNTVYRCWAVPFWHGRWALDRHSTMMINGCSRFMRHVKRCNYTFCLPTQYWLTGYACNKLWKHNIKLFSIGIFNFF